MSLYASFSEDANGVFSTFAGKIKDSGDGLWSPIYGAGEGNIRPSRRFARLRGACGSLDCRFRGGFSFSAPIRTLSQLLTSRVRFRHFVPIEEGSVCCPLLLERVYKSHFLYPSIFNGSGLSFCDSSRNRLQILQLLRYGFSPIAVIRGK